MSPSEKAMLERERRRRLQALRQRAPLSSEEQQFYPSELAHALRLIEAVARKLDSGDRYDQQFAGDLRGLARALEDHAHGIASSKAFRETKRHPWKRRVRRFADRFKA